MPNIFLIPSFISDDSTLESLPEINYQIIRKLRFFAVENLRSARRYLSKIGIKNIDDLTFFEINKHANRSDIEYVFNKLKKEDLGIISDAGCPSVADPGALLVEYGHKHNFNVNPLVGPNSIILALMGSGLNGQNFNFLGYLPIKDNEKIKTIRKVEQDSKKNKNSQIFIETPYRNVTLLKSIIKNCHTETVLCIASDLQGRNQKILTKKINDWKRVDASYLHKVPSIFILESR